MITNIDSKLIKPNTREIRRYLGVINNDELTEKLIFDCWKEVFPLLSPKICYEKFNINTTESIVDFGDFSFESKNLAKNLKDCDKAVIFVATLGINTERLLQKYSKTAPLKALIMQATLTDSIESVCNIFCKDIAKKTRPRFSPGYGDLNIANQKIIFKILNCEKNIGVYLTEGMLMVPTKSVSAIVGILN